MSLLSSFKKALGFPDEYDEELDAMESDTDITGTAAVSSEPAPKQEISIDTATAVPEHPDTEAIAALPGKIFDAVIELFNATQPEFVKQCLDTDAQRKYIIENIDKSVRQRFDEETAAARRRGEQLWEAEKKRMSSDLDKLKSQYHSLQQQREEFQSAQLSAARQKRAMNERIHDLENQVNTLQAEREQYQLENRSMLNKLRVAGVRNSGNGDTEAELQRLAEENVSLQDRITTLNTRIEQDKATIDELQKSLAERPEADPALSEEHQAAIAEIEEQIKQFENIKKKKDAKIAELQSAAKRTATHINKIEEELAARDSAIEKLTDEAASLRKTIETNLYAQATSESELKQEIERLKELINAAEEKKTEKSRRATNKHKASIVEDNGETTYEAKKQPEAVDTKENVSEPTTVRISAIDELMDSTDWFVAPDPVPLKKDPSVEEDFGYKEPVVRKTNRDDDKQLSLW